MRVPRWAGILALLAMTAPGVVAHPASAQSSPPLEAIIADALDRLDDLQSYRVTSRSTSSSTPGRTFGVEATVVGGPARAWQTTSLSDGEPINVMVVIGTDGWSSYAGSAFISIAEMGGVVPSGGRIPVSAFSTVERFADRQPAMSVVGPEIIDGVAALHYRGVVPGPQPSATSDPSAGHAMSGTIDLWVDAERGHLLKAITDVADRLFVGTDDDPAIDRHEEVAVVGVDDPANVVEPPDLTVVSPSSPPGDPAMAAVVSAAIAALDDLISYRLVLDFDSVGFSGRQESVVLNGEPPSSSTRLLVDGTELVTDVVIGDRAWSRNGRDGAWVTSPDPADGPFCNGTPCGSDMTSGRAVLDVVDAIGGSITVVGEETVDGILATHLRSQQPIIVPPYGPTPTASDLWIAQDGGHLLRWTTDGVGTRTDLRVEGVDDPANSVPEPSPAAPAEP